jgi:hypothetical protein
VAVDQAVSGCARPVRRDWRLPEGRTLVVEAVAQQRVGDAVRSLQRCDLVEVGQLRDAAEVDGDDRERELASPPSLQQRFFDAIGL